MAYLLPFLICTLSVVTVSVRGRNGYSKVNVLTPSACISKGPSHTLKPIDTTGKLTQKTFSGRTKGLRRCWTTCIQSKQEFGGAECVKYTFNQKTKVCTIFTNKFERNFQVVHGTWICQKKATWTNGNKQKQTRPNRIIKPAIRRQEKHRREHTSPEETEEDKVPESQGYLSVEAIQGYKVIGQSLNATFRGKVKLAPGRKGLGVRMPVCTSKLVISKEQGCIGRGRCSSGFSMSVWIRPQNTWHFFVKKGNLLFVLYRQKNSPYVYIRATANKKMVFKGFGNLRSRAGWVHIFLSVSAKRTGMFVKTMVDARRTFSVLVNQPISGSPGVFSGPINIMASMRDADNLNIGCHEGWEMRVDEIRFWNSSLSMAEVKALFKSDRRGVPSRVTQEPVTGSGKSEHQTTQTTEEKVVAVSKVEPERKTTEQEPEKNDKESTADDGSDNTSESEAERRRRREEEELQKSNNGMVNGTWNPGSTYCLPMSRVEHNQVIGPLNGTIAGNVTLAPGLGKDKKGISITTCGGNVTYCKGNVTCRDDNGAADDCLSNRGRCVSGFTISLMVLPPLGTSWRLGISKGSIRFMVKSRGRRSIRVEGYAATRRFYAGKGMLNERGWLHVVIVVDERLKVQVNLNGVKVRSRQRRLDSEPETLLKGATMFGATPPTRNPCFKDKGIRLDEIRLWNSTICTHSCRKLYQLERRRATGTGVVV